MSGAGPRRALIDADPGVDDALALLLALASPELKIEAVTVVAGNAPVRACARNALRTIAASGTSDPPPVALGCDRPLRRDLVTAPHVHGDDGLGDVVTAFDQGLRDPLNAHAVDVMLNAVSARPGEITIIALGPLTNLATAILRDPSTMALAREIVLMGGAVACPGNVTEVAEYNFFADPEAAQVVLSSGIAVALAPLDATTQAGLDRDELERRVRASARPCAGFVAAISERYFDFQETERGAAVCLLHDPVAVGLAMDRTLGRFVRLRGEVETDGKLTTGMLVADRRVRRTGRENLAAAMELDARRFLDLFLDRVLGPA